MAIARHKDNTMNNMKKWKVSNENPVIVYVEGNMKDWGICITESSEIESMSRKNAEANAAFIVRACNSHQALIEALRAALDELYATDDFGHPIETYQQIEAALANARPE